MVECELNFLSMFHMKTLVLIDTWWNVNEITSSGTMLFTSFNRYMVECEYELAWL